MDRQKHGSSEQEAGVASDHQGGEHDDNEAPPPVPVPPAELSPQSVTGDYSLMTAQFGTYSDSSTGYYSSTLGAGTDDHPYLIPEDTAKIAAAQDIVTDDTGKEVDNAVNYDTGKELDMMRDVDTAKEIVPLEWQTTQDTDLAAAEAKRRKKRRRCWIGAVVVSVTLIGIIVGLTVGLLVGRRSGRDGNTDSGSGASPDNSPGLTSACNGTVCHQILSAATIDTDVHVFARGTDQAIWTRTLTGNTSSENWTSLGGPFKSQPTSISWNASNPQINVFASITTGSIAATKYYTGGSWANDWRAMRESTGSAMGVCHVKHADIDRPDVFVQKSDGSGLIHDWYDNAQGEWADQGGGFGSGGAAGQGGGTGQGGGMGQGGGGGSWDASAAGNATSTPAVACRDNDTYHDLVIYGEGTRSVQHNQWNNSWFGWNDRGGSFAADPVLVSPTSTRVDFFGTGTDGAIWHFTWTPDGYTALESLGGQFESMPSVVATTADRIDIVAVGTDHRLKHRVLMGSTLSWAWEDIDSSVVANSAPLLVSLSQPSRLGVLVLGLGGDLLYATWDVTEEFTWSTLSSFKSLGGNLTTSWF